jgi:hypothetical protein
MLDAGIWEKYVNSIYYSLTTMTTCGYGDNHAHTTSERITSMAAMIISSGVFAFIIGDIGRLVSSMNVISD